MTSERVRITVVVRLQYEHSPAGVSVVCKVLIASAWFNENGRNSTKHEIRKTKLGMKGSFGSQAGTTKLYEHLGGYEDPVHTKVLVCPS